MTPLRFHRALNELDVWSARSDRYSFVITYGSPNGPGLHGSAGYLASWRPVHPSSLAVKIIGSPFRDFRGRRGGLQPDAEGAGRTSLKRDRESQKPVANISAIGSWDVSP
jgi:hypothetical protein